MFATVNTKKFPREYLDQVISSEVRDGARERAPDPGLKLQASRSRDQAPSFKLQAASLQHLDLDRSLIQGYSRIKKKEKRTYAKLNASRPRTVVTRRKYCSRNCSALEATDPGHKFPFEFKASSAKLFEHQATSVKPQAASFKLQATSDKLPDA
jgi:hypothetical protein